MKLRTLLTSTLLLLALLLVGCASDKAQTKPAPGPSEDMEIACGSDASPGFIVNDVCHETQEAACAALACADNEECIVHKSKPPQVECKEMAAPSEEAVE